MLSSCDSKLFFIINSNKKNVAVRNTGTWAGNLALKNKYQDFPSDVFISFLSVNATLTLIDGDKTKTPIQVNLDDFLKTDLIGKFLYSVSFKPYDKAQTWLKTFKIMPRYRNAHAYVNAGFNFSINPTTFVVQMMPTIVFGGIDSSFVHAKQTENFLNGKKLNDQSVLLNAFKILSNELQPKYSPDLASIEYRKSLAISLLYKFFLYVNDKVVSPIFKSGQMSVMDMRQVSTSKQVFPTANKDMFPVTQPITKLNAYYQTSGEAKYVYDMSPLSTNQLFGVFIQSDMSNCKLGSIDYNEASKMPGVVKILLASDIKGQNNFNVASFLTGSSPEEVFCSSNVLYAGQGLGLVLAGNF
jgi:xanthine dehydrogenase/oxidase